MAAPKPLPQLQPDRFAVGLFDCCAAPGGCGRCAHTHPFASPRIATWPARRYAACVKKGPTAIACCSSRRSSDASMTVVGLSAADARAAPVRARTCASQALTSRSADRARSASSPASCLPRARGAWDCCAAGVRCTCSAHRSHAALTPPCCARSFAGNCCAAGWAYVGLQILAGFAGGARSSHRQPVLLPHALITHRPLRRPSHLVAPALSVPPEHTPRGWHACVWV